MPARRSGPPAAPATTRPAARFSDLAFTISNGMKQRMVETLGRDLRLNGIVPVRMTAVMPDAVAPPGAKTVATVAKLEFLDEEGGVVSTIE